MRFKSLVWKAIWKTPVVVIALIFGCFGARQAGWSGAELIVNARLMGLMEGLITVFVALAGIIVFIGVILLIHKIAKLTLWFMMPIFLYFAVVLGAWNGFGGDFDETRVEAIKHHLANAYALEHMNTRARLISCRDTRIDLTDDAKAVCARTSDVDPEGQTSKVH